MDKLKKLKATSIEYTENTTIHGLKYLNDNRRFFIEKLYWIVVFAISFLYLCVFVQNVLKKYNEKSSILVDDERPTSIYEIPFPAVTVCPVIKIKSEYFSNEEIFKWAETKMGIQHPKNMVMDLADLICAESLVRGVQNYKETIEPYLNTSHIELLHKISSSFDIFKFIKFASKEELDVSNLKDGQNKSDIPFSYILTNEGICFTFNVPSEIIADKPSLQTDYKYHNIQNKSSSWQYEYGYYGYPRFPRSVWGIGPRSGLYLNLIANGSDLNTFCQPSETGYKILLHSPDEYPTTLEKFISIPHSTKSKIRVIPKITKTSSEVSKLHPQVRQCYFNHERKLTFFTYYNRINCKLECLANYTQQQYGCVHFSLPRNASQPICGTDVTISQVYDTEEIMDSYFQFKEEMHRFNDSEIEDDDLFDFETFSNLKCNCLPACMTVDYEYSIEMESIDMEKLLNRYIPRRRSKPPVLVLIDIFFGKAKIIGATRRQFYTLADLISNVGGLLGLFMGASILSIFEVIYFLFVR